MGGWLGGSWVGRRPGRDNLPRQQVGPRSLLPASRPPQPTSLLKDACPSCPPTCLPQPTDGLPAHRRLGLGGRGGAGWTSSWSARRPVIGSPIGGVGLSVMAGFSSRFWADVGETSFVHMFVKAATSLKVWADLLREVFVIFVVEDAGRQFQASGDVLFSEGYTQVTAGCPWVVG